MWKLGKYLTNRAFLVAQMVKNLPAMQKTQAWSLGWENPLEKGMATHSSILAWRIPWTEEPGGLQFMRLQRGGHDWGTNTFTLRRASSHQMEIQLRGLEGAVRDWGEKAAASWEWGVLSKQSALEPLSMLTKGIFYSRPCAESSAVFFNSLARVENAADKTLTGQQETR